MNLHRIKKMLPSLPSIALALLAAVLLILAFPDLEIWLLAWFAPVPLLLAIERESVSSVRGFLLGWLFGTVFFFGTCWWLTFAPITYAGFPPVLAYFLLLLVCIAAALFHAVFGGVMALLLRRFGSVAMLAAPFVWVFTEFARYWLTGNNWNAIGYSQAFVPAMIKSAAWGGIYAVAFLVILGSSLVAFRFALPAGSAISKWLNGILAIFAIWGLASYLWQRPEGSGSTGEPSATVIALQPNVPMSGLTEAKWEALRERHVRLAEIELANAGLNDREPTTVIFPESPMNFQYEDDAETKAFIDGFASKHNVSVLFNSAEPNHADGKFYNSAVMVGPEGREVAQYDKIYLLPFGEAVPAPLENIVPAFVGSFSYGTEYDLFSLGDAKAGVMICFESHFGELSREYVRNGADAIIEMTNDGYLGSTPVLRQHLANAVFRAVETNRPVLRVTNVGITAYINERGEVLDAAPVYQEASRVWTVAKSDGSQTLYVRYGDWFAWLCSVLTVVMLLFSFRRCTKAE